MSLSLAQTAPKVRAAMRLLPDEAAYAVSVEIQHAIEMVVLQSTVDVLLLDVDSNVAILSRSPVVDAKANGGGNALLATYRCAE